jgi:ABC-type Fe3+/spermidine/putrescine transport system ATPase subunit
MIRVENLTKVFDKRGIAGLNGISFQLDAGKIFAVLGPNGSGKTTLLNVLAGDISHESGTKTITGQISRFPNQEETFNMNVQKFLIQSVTLPIEEEKKIQLARDLADTFEFTFQLRQNLNELSSGQKQKILLSRELINRPALLLMDEPFTHLDPFTRKDILNGLFQYIRQQHITVLWVTHDLQEAYKYSDIIGVMNFGKFEQIGSPQDVIRNPKNLFVAQFTGYRNFFPVKQVDGKWQSPWGELPFPVTDKEHAILVVPDHAWIWNEAGTKMQIEETYAGIQSMEYVCKFGEQKVFVSKSPMDSLHEVNAQVLLAPKIALCFVIPL